MSSTTLRDYLASNPKAMGILFTLAIAIAETGSVVAANGSTTVGP